MKLKFVLFITFILNTLVIKAQERNSNHERLKAMKIGMITEKLQLTSDQAKDFWPVYDQYSAEKMTISRGIREKMRAGREAELTADQHLKMQEEVLNLQAKELDLTKKYRSKFLDIISAKQYSDLMLTEKQFNQMLLKELQDRRSGRH